MYFNETADERSIPIAQDLGSDMPAFTTIHLDDTVKPATALARDISTSQHATISVTAQIAPTTPLVDASHMIFGLSTTLSRIPETIRNLQHWASHTNARFVISVAPHDPSAVSPLEPTISEATRLFHSAGIPHVTFHETTDWWGDAYVGLMPLLHSAIEPNLTRWTVWIDDDTFFPRFSSLVEALDTRFDASLPQYVGQLSEYFPNTAAGGLVAFGGAGVFLSVPLMDQLVPHSRGCYEHQRKGKYTGGDFRIADCVRRYSTTKLSVLEGLSQMDFQGDVSGFYEAERTQPLSVHHWKSWHTVDMPLVGRVKEVCGDACVLQHFRLGGGLRMTNGFSIVRYSEGWGRLLESERLDDVESEEWDGKAADGVMEKTWKDESFWDKGDVWDSALAPLTKRDDGKKQYLMERMENDAEGNLVVDYVLREKGVGKGLIRLRMMASSS